MMKRRKRREPEKRNQERYGVTLQLIYGVDDDLIELIQNTKPEVKQAALKSALRRALDLPEPLQSASNHAMVSADIEQRLNAMQAQLDMARMFQGSSDTSADVEQLRQELSVIKAALHQLNAAIANGAGLSAIPDDEPTVDEDTLARRNKRLRQTNW